MTLCCHVKLLLEKWSLGWQALREDAWPEAGRLSLKLAAGSSNWSGPQLTARLLSCWLILTAAEMTGLHPASCCWQPGLLLAGWLTGHLANLLASIDDRLASC